MYQADLYIRNNGLQQADTDKVLRNSFNLIRWNPNGMDTVLDLGCGSGDKTKEVLMPMFPQFKSMVGVDISEDMLEYAQKHNAHEKIKYRQMDVADPDQIPNDMINAFDHAFSFHVVHWVKNQKQLFKNLFKMLRPGGDMLSFFVVNTDLMRIYEKIAKIPKWSEYMQNVSNIFPYQHCDEPLEALETILNHAGFSHMVKFEKREFVYNSREHFNTSMAVINPFIKNIPKDLHDEYIEEFAHIAEHEVNFFVKDSDHGEMAIVPYTLAVMYLRKPEMCIAG